MNQPDNKVNEKQTFLNDLLNMDFNVNQTQKKKEDVDVLAETFAKYGLDISN